VTIDGKLWRPVQNCTDGYGAALGLAEIVELTPTASRQEQPFDGRFLNFHGQDSFFAVTGGWLYSASV
jgi:hypothetical protein